MRQLFAILMLWSSVVSAQNMYFPPVSGNSWETLSPDSLGWCQERIDSLYAYLDAANSKAFIVLKGGRIVLEKYFDTHTAESPWYWASAGKSLTAYLVGIAQEEGYLDIGDPTAMYLGEGWTDCTPEQEAAITIRHQLTMSSGLDDGVDESDCTLDTCLVYLAEPGTRWAYHNAPYTLLEQVIESATGVTANQYTNQKIKTPTGMSGLWIFSGYNNVYWSNARTFARFGILAANNGIWANDTLLHDETYKYDMLHQSQDLNEAYGYLWWLNSSETMMLPGVQIQIPGNYAPDAPFDVYSALGKDGQICSVSKSEDLIVIRMGEAPSTVVAVPVQLCNEIWKQVMDLGCEVSNTPMMLATLAPKLTSTLVQDVVQVEYEGSASVKVFDMQGKLLVQSDHKTVPVNTLLSGVYVAIVTVGNQPYALRFVKL